MYEGNAYSPDKALSLAYTPHTLTPMYALA
jgi:hypothetical protein